MKNQRYSFVNILFRIAAANARSIAKITDSSGPWGVIAGGKNDWGRRLLGCDFGISLINVAF